MEDLPTNLRKLAIKRFPEIVSFSSCIAIVVLGAGVLGREGMSRSGAEDA